MEWFNGKKMNANMLKNKPIFDIKVESFGVSFYLKVNGVSIMKEMDSFGQISTTLPVNHWMTPGENSIGIIVFPDEEGEKINPNSYVKMELWVQSLGGAAAGHMIASINFSGAGIEKDDATSESSSSGTLSSEKGFLKDLNGDVDVKAITTKTTPDFEGVLIFNRELVVPSSLPLWKFFDSEKLPDYDEMSDEDYFAALDQLFVEYKKVQDALSVGDVESIVSMARERSLETDLAFYLESGTTERRLRASLKGAVQDDNLELAELHPDYVSIRVEDNRRLVRLIRGGETSAVGFNFKSFTGSQSYDFIFRRENGKWIVAR